jgi:hypothetical protein
LVLIQDALKKPWPNVPPPPKVPEIAEEQEEDKGKETAGMIVP